MSDRVCATCGDEHRTVTVCSRCKTAACWLGEFYCDEAKTADVVEMKPEALAKLGLESPDYWRPERRHG